MSIISKQANNSPLSTGAQRLLQKAGESIGRDDAKKVVEPSKRDLTAVKSEGFQKLVKYAVNKVENAVVPDGQDHLLTDEQGVSVDENVLNHLDTKGNTPLTHAIKTKDPEAVRELVTNSQVEINKADKHGNPPVILAIQSGSLQIVELVLGRNDIKINKFNKIGTPLHIAIQGRQTEMVKALLNYEGISVNTKDLSQGDTPLMHAVKIGNVELIEHLSRFQEIDPNGSNAKNQTPLGFAVEMLHMPMIQALLKCPNLKIETLEQVLSVAKENVEQESKKDKPNSTPQQIFDALNRRKEEMLQQVA